MRPIDVNFASAPFRNNTPYYLGYAVGVLAIAGFTAFNAWAFFAYSQSRAELESDHAAKRVRLENLYRDAAKTQELIKQKNIPAMNAKAAFTNGLLERRRFSWTDLLNSLEEVQPYQVRLQSLIPRIQEKGILIESRGVAKDLKAYWNFQQNLQNHPKFRRAYPGGYLHNGDAGEYIFNLSFNYFPMGAPMDVQGLTPELAGADIEQAPGSGPSSAPQVSEEPESSSGAPPSNGHKPRVKTPAASRAASAPAQRPVPPGPPTAQSNRPPSGGNPPGVQAQPDPNQVAVDPPGGRGASPLPSMAPSSGTTVVGGANPTQPAEGDANGTGRAGRWQGRGAIPGQGGKRPPAPKKPEGLPTMKLPPPPDPDNPDNGDNQ